MQVQITSMDDELNAGILLKMIWFLHIYISQLCLIKTVFSWAWNKSNTLWFSGKDECTQCKNLLNEIYKTNSSFLVVFVMHKAQGVVMPLLSEGFI